MLLSYLSGLGFYWLGGAVFEIKKKPPHPLQLEKKDILMNSSFLTEFGRKGRKKWRSRDIKRLFVYGSLFVGVERGGGGRGEGEMNVWKRERKGGEGGMNEVGLGVDHLCLWLLWL